MTAFVLARLPLFEFARVLVHLDARCQRHRKRESQHRVTDCGVSHILLRCRRHSARRTTGDRTAAHRKLDRRRDLR